MRPELYRLSFNGALLNRGYWLYVWKVTTDFYEKVYYVGRTGDSGSPNAQSPFNRLGQHLGYNEHQNMLRKKLIKNNIIPESCEFELIVYGPIRLVEAEGWDEHRKQLDIIGPLEKRLCDELLQKGHKVLNSVTWKKAVSPQNAAILEEEWNKISTALSEVCEL